MNYDVAFFISTMNSGGAERQLSILVNKLVRENKKICIYSLTSESEESFYPLDKRVDYFRLNLQRTGHYTVFQKIKFSIKRLCIFRRIIKSLNSNCKVVSFMDLMNLFCLVASLGLNKKVIVSERSDPNYQPKSKSIRCIINFFYLFAYKIIVQSETAKEYFKCYSKKTIVIHNGFEFSSKAPSFQKKNNLEFVRFVSVARLSEEKRVLELVDILIKLYKRGHTNFKMEIYGRGVLQDRLNQKIQDKTYIQYMGVSKEISKVMERSDALLLASVYEGFPNVIVEALSVGTRVFCTPTAGAKEIQKVLDTKAVSLIDYTLFEDGLCKFLKGCNQLGEEVTVDLSSFSVDVCARNWQKEIFS